jgi:hypothetical protein
MSTEVVTRDLFAASSPGDITAAATEVANQLADVVRQRKMTMQIGGREHILVEGWQTLGALTGVFAVDDGVEVQELPWPFAPRALSDEETEIARKAAGKRAKQRTDEEKRLLTRMRQCEARELGGAWGYVASFKAMRNGQAIGWGEGRCTREEATWAGRESYALSSMAQTRGQSRALAAPLKFIVKLTGYETTPAEEMAGVAPAETTPEHPFGPPAMRGEIELALEALEEVWPGSEPKTFMRGLDEGFGQLYGVPGAKPLGHMPRAATTALRYWAQWIGSERAAAESSQSASQDQGSEEPAQGDAQSAADTPTE